MRVAVAADHAGFPLKAQVLAQVLALGHEGIDLGTDSEAPVDYPDFARAIGQTIASGRAERGVLLCGSGVGASVAANKLRGVRAAICHDTYSARQGVEHDDLNVLTLGARVIGPALVPELVRAFLDAKFTGEERHLRRLRKVIQLEEESGRGTKAAGPAQRQCGGMAARSWDGRQQGALSSDSAEQTLAALKGTLARLGLDETVLKVSETIDPLRQAPPLVEERKLQRLFAGESDLFPLRELGRGGMGVVHLAEQASLARQVAIKTTRSKDPAVARALVREACIMGALEHPNLVPVHALGLGEDGSPVLVMKRVEGVSWTELLNQADHPAWPPLLVGHGDRLRAHIDILSQVSRALSFAHDRGVVHRDLKPDNVMIGRFGEVYLLDWGLALRLSERATEPVSVVGTPGFLAPEMAKGDPTLVDARTDVYLLGATLYRVLTGRMPHEAPTLIGALLAAVNGVPPPMSNDVPTELVALVRVAMARDRAARLPSAEAFREGLAQYLISREVDVIVSDARASYARAEASMLTEGPASATAFRTLVEARFGLASAHRMRPGDLGIATQLDATVTKLVEHELALHSPGAARAFLSELVSPPAALVQRVDALEAEVALERTASDELARKRREADASKMVLPLSRALVMGWTFLAPLALWIAWPALESGQGFLPWRALAFDLALLAVLGAIFFTLRKTLFATEGTARVSTAFLFWALGMAAADVVTVALGGSTNDATLHSETAGLVLASMATATVIRELWPAVLIAIATVLAVIVAPHFSPAFALLNASLAIPVSARAFRLHAARLRSEGQPARDPHGPNAVRG